MNNIDLKGKTAIVTGAGAGIGRGIAVKLAEHHANVMVCDMNEEAMAETVAQIEAADARGLAFRMDVTSEADAQRMIDTCVKTFGSVDLLYNNAGTISMSSIEELSLEAWEKIFAVNCRGVFLCSRAVIPQMKRQGEDGSSARLHREARPGCSC